MRKKILLPTDFSKNAWNAVEYAIKLYKDVECDFYLLNIFKAESSLWEEVVHEDRHNKLFDIAENESKEGLEKLIKRLSIPHSNTLHKFYPISKFKYDNFFNALKSVVDSNDFELVIMGTRGASIDRDRAYGTNTIAIMEKLRSCTVLAIPSVVTYQEPKEIVFTTQFEFSFKKREIEHLIEVSKISKATIRILYIGDKEELNETQIGYKKKLEKHLSGITYKFHYIKRDNVTEAIKYFIESRESDMVAFINRKQAFFDLIFNRTMVKKLGYHSKIPVLAMHDWKG